MHVSYRKRGRSSKKKVDRARGERDVSPESLYAPVSFGGSRPGPERRFTGNYGKNGKARGGEPLGPMSPLGLMPRF